MQYIDLSTATDIRIGGNTASQVYLGNNLIWPQNQHDYSQDYFTIEALSPIVYVKYNNCKGITQGQYSLDNGLTWNNFPHYYAGDWDDMEVNYIQLTAGQKMLIRDTQGSQNYNNIPQFKIAGLSDVYGNIMSLSEGDAFNNVLALRNSYQFSHIFYQTDIAHAHNLILPATTLTDDCYEWMFSGCTSLVNAPELPATSLSRYCYRWMFEDCTSLTTAPALPATTLAYDCYDGMFHGCTSLVTAPALPATTLADSCYSGMFNGCTSLTTAPELPATILIRQCYEWMFSGCTSLNNVKMMATDITATGCINNMLNNVAASGTFYKNSAATWNDNELVPNGWSVITVTP